MQEAILRIKKKGMFQRDIWDMILEAGDEGKGEAEEKLRYVWLG